MVTSEPMHARSHACGAALCGATGKFAWSLDPDAVTCSRCRATLLMLGEPLRRRGEEPLITPIYVRTVYPADAPEPPRAQKAAGTRRPTAPAARRDGADRPRGTAPRPKKRR